MFCFYLFNVRILVDEQKYDWEGFTNMIRI